MISDLFEDRRCVCGHPRWTRLFREETPNRISYLSLCESCGRIARAIWCSWRSSPIDRDPPAPLAGGNDE